MNRAIRELFFKYVKNIRKSGPNPDQYTGRCPFHDDEKNSFSFNVDTGLWKCHADSGCGSGNAYQFAKKLGIDPEPYKTKKEVPVVSQKVGHKSSTVQDEKNPIAAPRIALGATSVQCHDYLLENFSSICGDLPWREDFVREHLVGFDPKKGRFTFPHFDEDGNVVAIRYHKTKELPPYSDGDGSCRWYPFKFLKEYSRSAPLIISEGQKDVITLLSQGYNAVTSTNGAGSIPKDLSPLKDFKKIIIVYDNDKPGRAGAAALAGKLKQSFPEMEIRIHRWKDGLPEGFDVTDYFRDGKSVQDFDELIGQAEDYELPEDGAEGSDLRGTEPILKITTWDELRRDTSPAPPEIIGSGILAPESTAIIVGPPKAGKTMLALQIMYKLANGQDVFGFGVERPYKVVFFQAEVSRYNLRRRIRRLSEGCDDGFECVDKIFLATRCSIDITNPEHFEAVCEEISRCEADVAFFDPLVKFHRHDENSNVKMAVVMERFREISQRCDCSIVLIHHSRKEQFDGVVTRGASAIFADVDTQIRLIPQKGRGLSAKLEFDLRNGGPIEPLNLVMNPNTLWFEQDNGSGNGIDSRILEAIQDVPETGIERKEFVHSLAEELGKNPRTVGEHVRKLIDAGQIKTDGKKRNMKLYGTGNNGSKGSR